MYEVLAKFPSPTTRERFEHAAVESIPGRCDFFQVSNSTLIIECEHEHATALDELLGQPHWRAEVFKDQELTAMAL